MALSKVGTRSTIASLTEQSKEAVAINTWYEMAREAIFQAARWNFTRAQASLVLLQDATATPPGVVPTPWVYEYAYPSDCVQGRYLIPNSASVSSTPGQVAPTIYQSQPVKFVIAADKNDAGQDIKVILSNQPFAILVYTRRVTDPNMWDGQFIQAFAAYLAHCVCQQLTGDKVLKKSLFDEANKICMDAMASNNNEGLTVIDNMPDWMRVRGYASDWAYPPGAIAFADAQALVMIT